MSTPELERAIAASRWRGAEANFTEAISKMLDIEPGVVARVVFAWETLKSQPMDRYVEDLLEALHGGVRIGEGLPEEIIKAIEHESKLALRRMVIRWKMECGMSLQVRFDKLVRNPEQVCDGCPNRLECVRDMLSTPRRCLSGAPVYPRGHGPKDRRAFQHVNALVRPTKLAGNIVTVDADHPLGTYAVNVMDVLI